MKLVAKTFLYAIATIVFAIALALIWVPCLPVTFTFSFRGVPGCAE